MNKLGKKGIALILVYMLIAVLLVLFAGGALLPRSLSESLQGRRHIYSITSYWLAEYGMAQAIEQLPLTDVILPTAVSVGVKQGTYTTQTTQLSATNYEITSTGAFEGLQRAIRANIELPSLDFGEINYAIETTGGLNITGSAEVNPEDSIQTNSEITFEGTFGVTKEEIRAGADNLFTNPNANQQPIQGITWVELTGGSPSNAATYSISSNWSGSGLLIINGNRNESTEGIAALDISGNWNFNGLIWVIGKVKITGTPVITGALIAESAVDVESTFGGNAALNFNSSSISGAFGLVNDALNYPRVESWYEI